MGIFGEKIGTDGGLFSQILNFGPTFKEAEKRKATGKSVVGGTLFYLYQMAFHTITYLGPLGRPYT